MEFEGGTMRVGVTVCERWRTDDDALALAHGVLEDAGCVRQTIKGFTRAEERGCRDAREFHYHLFADGVVLTTDAPPRLVGRAA